MRFFSPARIGFSSWVLSQGFLASYFVQKKYHRGDQSYASGGVSETSSPAALTRCSGEQAAESKSTNADDSSASSENSEPAALVKQALPEAHDQFKSKYEYVHTDENGVVTITQPKFPERAQKGPIHDSVALGPIFIDDNGPMSMPYQRIAGEMTDTPHSISIGIEMESKVDLRKIHPDLPSDYEIKTSWDPAVIALISIPKDKEDIIIEKLMEDPDILVVGTELTPRGRIKYNITDGGNVAWCNIYARQNSPAK